MKDKADLETAQAKAKIEMQREEQDARQKLAEEDQAFKQRLAQEQADFEMDLAAYKALKTQEIADKNFEAETARKERPNEPRLDAIGKIIEDLHARISAPPRRRRLRTYRDANDNLIGEEEFIEEPAAMPVAAE